jgi:TonB family protein
VRISYSPEGDVVEATLVRSSGSEKVDAELVRWVKSMKFKPSQTGSSGVVPIDIKQAR